MTPKLTLIVGDVLTELRKLPDESVQCWVTSPPYWGLRDYGIAPSIWGGDPACDHDFAMSSLPTEKGKGNWAQGTNGRGELQPGGVDAKREPIRAVASRGFCSGCGAWKGCLGLEPTPELFVSHQVMIFEEARRVLKKNGTLWCNMGDSYSSQPGQRKPSDKIGNKQSTNGGSFGTGSRSAPSLKPKDLCGMPWRLAFALQAAGWYLRQDIIWHKPNPMPESVTDRCTKAHEYIFLLSKTPRYYYDQDAIREPASPGTHARMSQDLQNQVGSARANGGSKTNGMMKAVARKQLPHGCENSDHYSGQMPRYPGRAAHGSVESRRQRKGDTLKSSPDKSRNGIRPLSAYKNGPRVKDNESMDSALAIMPLDRNKRSVWTVPTFSFSDAHFATFPPDLIRPCILAGSRPGDVVGDMYGGSGTTGMVALWTGRNALLIELNPEYAAMARRRCEPSALDRQRLTFEAQKLEPLPLFPDAEASK